MQPNPLATDSRPVGLAPTLAQLVPPLIGIALLALVGFVPYPAVHDAFHDVRHTAGFPCH